MISAEEIIDKKRKHNRHYRYICSKDGGNILTLYARVFAIHNTRLFKAINMYQCDKCFQFYALLDGSHNLVPLIVEHKMEMNKNEMS